MGEAITADKVVVQLEAKADGYQTTVLGAERQFTGSMGRIGAAAGDAEKKVVHSSVNVGQALKDVFNSSRLAVIEEGSTKLRVFGSAIEPLGVYGVAAAAGIAGLFGVLEESHKFAEFAEDVEVSARALGLSTAKMQEFDFVAKASGLSVETFRGALRAGNEALGAFQSNIGDERMKEAFKALGFTKDQLRGYNNIADLLPVLSDRIKNLGSVAEQAKVAEALGLGGILPALEKGSAGFSELAAEAHKYGLILNEDVIKKGTEAADKSRIAGEVIKTNLRSAFADLAPIIAKASEELAKFIGLVTKVDPQKAAFLVRQQIDQTQKRLDEVQKGGVFGGFLGGGLGGLTAGGRANIESVLKKQLADQQGKLKGLTEPAEPDTTKATAKPLGIDRAAAEAAKKALEVQKASADAIAQALSEQLTAHKALVVGVEQELAAQLATIEAQRKKKDADLDLDAKSGKITEAAATQAKTATDAAAADQAALAKREARYKLEDQAFELTAQGLTTLGAIADLTHDYKLALETRLAAIENARQTDDANVDRKGLSPADAARAKANNDAAAEAAKIAATLADRSRAEQDALKVEDATTGAQVSHLESLAGLAHTTAQRLEIERRILELQKEEERRALQQQTNDLGRSPADRQAAQVALDHLDEKYSDKTNDLYEGVHDAFKSGILGALEAAKGGAGSLAQYFGDKLKESLLENLANQLADILTGAYKDSQAGGGGGGFLSAVANAGAQVFTGGRASGGNVVAGVGYNVNERGQLEGFQPAQSGKIVPLGNALAGSGGGVTVVQPIYNDFKGAVMTNELVAEMDRRSRAHATDAKNQAVSIASKGAPGRLAQNQKLGT